MGRTVLNNENKRKNLTISMSNKEREELESLANDMGMSISALFRFLVRKELKNN